MAKLIDYTALTDLQLLNVINSPKPTDDAVREMRARSGGYLPFADGKIVSDAALKFLKHVSDLRSNGKAYSGSEYRGVKLAPLATILAAPKVALTCEPFTGHELESDGTDPQTEMGYPVADNDRMLRLAWIADRLPSIVGTINLTDLDWQQTVMDMLSSGELKPNVRKLMKDFGSASEDEKKAVARRLKPEFWSGGAGQTQNVTQAVEPKPIDLPMPAPNPAPLPIISPTDSNRPVHMHFVSSGEDLEYIKKLRKHMYVATNVRKRVSISTDAECPPGHNVSSYRERLYAATDVFVYMVSSSTLAECGQEIDELLRRFPNARHVPVMCRPTFIKGSVIGHLVVLPPNGKAIASWGNIDEAMSEVSVGLSNVADAILAKR
jgi:hypothetical protein